MEAKVTRGHRKGKDAKGPGGCLEVQGVAGRASPRRGATAGAGGQGGDTEGDSCGMLLITTAFLVLTLLSLSLDCSGSRLNKLARVREQEKGRPKTNMKQSKTKEGGREGNFFQNFNSDQLENYFHTCCTKVTWLPALHSVPPSPAQLCGCTAAQPLQEPVRSRQGQDTLQAKVSICN